MLGGPWGRKPSSSVPNSRFSSQTRKPSLSAAWSRSSAGGSCAVRHALAPGPAIGGQQFWFGNRAILGGRANRNGVANPTANTQEYTRARASLLLCHGMNCGCWPPKRIFPNRLRVVRGQLLEWRSFAELGVLSDVSASVPGRRSNGAPKGLWACVAQVRAHAPQRRDAVLIHARGDGLRAFCLLSGVQALAPGVAHRLLLSALAAAIA